MENNNKNITALLDNKHFKAFRYKKDNHIKNKNIFTFIWNIIKNWFKFNPDIMFRLGSHIITGYPGCGKTLLCNWVIRNVDPKKYFILSNIKEFEGVPQFKIADIFKDNQQVRKFPTTDELGRKLYAVVFDEINLTFNKRLNRKSEYNDIFVGVIEFLVSHRHQHVPRVYFIGQKLELQDTQLQSLFKYQHNIFFKKEKYKYWHYLYNDFLQKIPVKLKIDNYVKTITDEGDGYEYIGVSKYKITPKILLTYNTYALADRYINKETTPLY